MPRISRGIFPHYPYHILNRGNARQKVFYNDSDYQAFIHLLAKAKKRHPLQILAFCLMPNHFHMCVITAQVDGISRFMQWLLTSHVRRVHAIHKTSGHIWQGRFKSFPIQIDTHLLKVMRYIEANPMRAKLVRPSQDWPWSSFSFRKNPQNLNIVDKPPVPLPENWKTCLNSSLPLPELQTIRQSIRRQSPLGEKLWTERIALKFGLLSTIHPRGRPPKTPKK